MSKLEPQENDNLLRENHEDEVLLIHELQNIYGANQKMKLLFSPLFRIKLQK